MKKKKLLFTIPSLNAGGGEKSLVNLLSQIDYSQYEVDLFLFDKSGIFLNLLPKEVKIIDKGHIHDIFTKDLKTSIKLLICEKKFKLVYARIMFAIKNRIIKNKSIAEQYTWKYISKSINILDKQYDAAIGYLEKSSIYFTVDKVKANKKIGFIHNDYDKLGMDSNIDNKYFESLDNIVTVSESCADVLEKRFPNYKEKIKIMYNIVSPNIIKKMASDSISINEEKINIVSVGRLHYQKGFDMAIEACKLLKNDGYDFIWNILGEGEERLSLEKMIKERNLEKTFILHGIKENPYPYIKSANIYAQPSRFEGKAIAIDEAKILHKPILVTNFSTAKDQINDEVNGLIVDMNAKSIYIGIKRMIDSYKMREKLSANLYEKELGTEKEIYKLYELVND